MGRRRCPPPITLSILDKKVEKYTKYSKIYKDGGGQSFPKILSKSTQPGPSTLAIKQSGTKDPWHTPGAPRYSRGPRAPKVQGQYKAPG